MSIPNDVMCAAKAAKGGRYHFWDQQSDRPLAPSSWPRTMNIPLATLSQEITTHPPAHPLALTSTGPFRIFNLVVFANLGKTC